MFYNQESLKTMFEEFDILEHVSFFHNGRQVVDEVNQHLELNEGQDPIGLIILDFNMPVMNGIEVVQEVKIIYEEFNKECRKTGEAELKLPTIAFFTGQQDEAFKSYCTKKGVDIFLQKPVSNQELFSLLCELELL